MAALSTEQKQSKNPRKIRHTEKLNSSTLKFVSM